MSLVVVTEEIVPGTLFNLNAIETCNFIIRKLINLIICCSFDYTLMNIIIYFISRLPL